MDNALKIVLLAVAAIIVAVLIVAAFSLVNSGQSLLSTGKSQINNSLSDYAEVTYTQYDGAVVAGSQVIGAIKNEWKDDNTVSIGVMTKDGANVWYDYSGNQVKTLIETTAKSANDSDSENVGFNTKMLPTKDAKGKSFEAYGNNAFNGGKSGSGSKQSWTCITATSGIPADSKIVADGNTASGVTGLVSNDISDPTTGYNSGASAGDGGYINQRSNFKGSVQRDINGNIRSVIFTQQMN